MLTAADWFRFVPLAGQRHLFLIGLLFLGSLTALLQQGSVANAADDDRLAGALQRLIAAHQGQVAVAIKHLPTGQVFDYRSDVPMPTASLIKLPVMVEAYQQSADGKLDLQQTITLSDKDKVPGSGILTKHFSSGACFTLRDAIRMMMAYSDNTATNLVIDRIGLSSVNQTMERLAFLETKINSQVFRRDTSINIERSKTYGLGSTTAGEMVALLEKLHQGKLASAAVTAEMLEHLYATEDKSGLPRLLPEGVRVAQKTGAVSAVRTAAGILESPAGTILICVLTSENRDQRWTNENAAEMLISELAHSTYEHFAAIKPTTVEPLAKAIKLGARGELVAALQRSLNLKNPTAARLTVDGDYGPATVAAVKEFQQQQGLEVTGEMDPKTWRALGPIADRDLPTPEPTAINSAPAPELKPETLDGPPVVTCKCWAVADAKTGAILASHAESDKVDIASTTKLMTALVVAKFCQADRAILDEVVTFSAAADATPGSSSTIREGEKLKVRDLLFGLLLPSGNDASVAIAEHFASRSPAVGEKATPVERFVAQMNVVAGELGMSDTTYKNPHGLTEEGHRSSARDQLKLAQAVIASDFLTPYFSTRAYGVQVESEAGYVRNVVWKNSNRLLDYEGYRGLKTGTTEAAGACLVSHFVIADQQLIAVVLGSSSSDARYVDTRNLLRWAASRRAAMPTPAP